MNILTVIATVNIFGKLHYFQQIIISCGNEDVKIVLSLRQNCVKVMLQNCQIIVKMSKCVKLLSTYCQLTKF